MAGFPWTEDRWLKSGSDPGSDDVLYHYNLLHRVLPTAVQDNMFHPLRAHSRTILLLLSSTYPLRCPMTPCVVIALFLILVKMRGKNVQFSGDNLMFYVLYLLPMQVSHDPTLPDTLNSFFACLE